MIPEIWKVFLFEWHRSLSVGRILTWLVLLLVPVALMGAVLFLTRSEIPSTFLYVATYILVPQVICMLGLLLWATPAIHSELEAKTWVYLAMRPPANRLFCSANTWLPSPGLSPLLPRQPFSSRVWQHWFPFAATRWQTTGFLPSR